MGAFGLILEPWATDAATTNPTVVPRAETAENKANSSQAQGAPEGPHVQQTPIVMGYRDDRVFLFSS